MRVLCAIFLCLLATTQSQVFKSGHRIKYAYSALVQNTIQEPASVTSQYYISANLYLSTFQDGCQLHFEDVTYSLYNGKDENIKTVKIHENDSSLNTPFYIKHDFTGKIENVFTDKTDAKWAIGMKKAISTLFQFDITKISLKDELSHTIEAHEHTPYGECVVNYMYQGNSSALLLKKWHGLSSCKSFDTKANLAEDPNFYKCQMSFQDSLNADSEKSYQLKVSDAGLIITDIESFNRITFSYFNAKSEVQVTQIRQHLRMINDHPLNIVAKMEKTYHTKFDEHLPSSFHNEDAFFNYYSDWDEQNIQYISQMIIQHLEGIHDISEEYLQTDVNKYHSYAISTLLNYLRPMSPQQLSHVYSQIKNTSSVNQGHLESLFFKIIPLVGTHDSTEFIMSLVRKKSVKNDIAINMIKTIPFHVRRADMQILNYFFFGSELLDGVDEDVKYVGWLAFASLTAKVSQNQPEEKVRTRHFVDRFIIDLKKTLTGQNYYKQMILISCMQNLLAIPHIHTYRVSKFLETILKKEIEITEDNQENIMASVIMAGKRMHSQDNKVLQSIYLPMLRNGTTISFKVQATAIEVLLMSPSMHIQTMLLWTMRNRIKDYKIYEHYCAAVVALTKAEDPCLNGLARNARKIMQFLPKKENNFNTILDFERVRYADYHDETYSFGASGKVTCISSSYKNQTYIFDAKKYVTGLFTRTSTIILRSNRFNYNFMYDPISLINRGNTEIFFITNGFVTEINIYSEKNMDQLIKTHYLDFFNSTSLFSDRFYIDMIQNDFLIPTDIGLPVRAFAEIPSLHRLRLNFNTKNEKRLSFTLSANLNEFSEQMFGLVSYGPLADVWHGSRRVYNNKGAVGIDLDMESLTRSGYKAKLYNPLGLKPGAYGYQTFVRSEVFIFEASDDGMFKKSCPECPNVQIAQRSKHQLNKYNIWSWTDDYTNTQHELVTFDCDRKVTPEQIAHQRNKFFGDIFNVHSERDLIENSLLKARHLLGLVISSPEPGTCGTAYYMKPKDGISNNEWFSSIFLTFNGEDPAINASFAIINKEGQKNIDILLDSDERKIEINKRDQSNYRFCIKYNSSDPEVDDVYKEYLHIQAEEAITKRGCIGNDTKITLTMKPEQDNFYETSREYHMTNRILHYDFKWENLPEFLNDWAFKIEDYMRQVFMHCFTRIFNKKDYTPQDELKLTMETKCGQVNLVVQSHYESFGYFNMTSYPVLQVSELLPPYYYYIKSFKYDKTESKLGKRTECDWVTLYRNRYDDADTTEYKDWKFVDEISTPDKHFTAKIFLKTFHDDKKYMGMRILTNNKDHEETFDVIPTHIENILFYNDDLLESGEQYSSVGDGLFKFKSIAGEMIEIYMDHMKISVYFDKFIIKYKNCYYNY